MKKVRDPEKQQTKNEKQSSKKLGFTVRVTVMFLTFSYLAVAGAKEESRSSC